MIDLSSIVTMPAKPGLLPFALDVGGGSDAAPDAVPSFALTLTDLMAVAAPAGAPVADGAKPAAGRQKAAATGVSLPELVAPMADDAGADPIIPGLTQDDVDAAESVPAQVAMDPAPDPQLEPALAWLLPPVSPPPPPVAPLRLAVTLRGKAEVSDGTPVAANDPAAPVMPEEPAIQGPVPSPVSGKTETKLRARTVASLSTAPAAPAETGAAPAAPVAVAALPVAALATAVVAVPVNTPAALPLRHARSAIPTATIKAAALAGVAPPVLAAADTGPALATPVAETAVPLPVAPVSSRPGPAMIRPAVVAPPVLAGPVSAPVQSSAAAEAVVAPAPPAAPPTAAPIPVAISQPASSPAAVAAAPTTAPVAAASQPIANTTAPARPDRPAPPVAARVQAERVAVANPPAAVRAAAAAPALAVEVAPRRATDPAAPAALATPLASTQPIALAAAGGAQQAGIDLTRDPGLHRMIDRIETLRDAADARDTRIRLIPDSLGPVDVSVRRDGNAVQVHFTATEAATRQLIADAQPRLTELAEARGVRIERATVDGGQPGNGQPGSYQSASAQSGGASTGQPRPHNHTPSQPAANHAPASALADPDEPIDDRIA